jgi:uncharacterized membrane protein YdjX (TVP38/TMEM64 family)
MYRENTSLGFATSGKRLQHDNISIPPTLQKPVAVRRVFCYKIVTFPRLRHFAKCYTSIMFKKYVDLVFVILLFVIANIVAHIYEKDLLTLGHTMGVYGVVFYFLTTVLAIIIPVWSNVFLIPIAVSMWGPLYTALLSILGWFIGSQIAFLLGRYLRKSTLIIFPSLHNESSRIKHLIDETHPLASLIFLRITLPVDILSYGLGLFAPHVTLWQNIITTVMGIIPFAFMFSYLSVLPMYFSTIVFSFTTTIFVIYVYIKIYKNNKG